MKLHRRIITAVLPATTAAVVLALACATEWGNAAPDPGPLPTIAAQPAATPAKPEPRWHDRYVSAEGRYALPIAWSATTVLEGAGGDALKWETVRANSADETWTRVFGPLDKRSFAPVSTEEGFGWDNFVRYYGEYIAQLRIVWTPKPAGSLGADFRQAAAFHRKLDTWISGSERSLRIGGFKALAGHFMAPTPRGMMYGTLAIVHVGERRYQIQYSYTNGFSDPDDTFEKLKQTQFDEVPVQTASMPR
jgi:hypothetical protein